MARGVVLPLPLKLFSRHSPPSLANNVVAVVMGCSSSKPMTNCDGTVINFCFTFRDPKNWHFIHSTLGQHSPSAQDASQDKVSRGSSGVWEKITHPNLYISMSIMVKPLEEEGRMEYQRWSPDLGKWNQGRDKVKWWHSSGDDYLIHVCGWTSCRAGFFFITLFSQKLVVGVLLKLKLILWKFNSIQLLATPRRT